LTLPELTVCHFDGNHWLPVVIAEQGGRCFANMHFSKETDDESLDVGVSDFRQFKFPGGSGAFASIDKIL
jgi:hypothetical protein